MESVEYPYRDDQSQTAANTGPAGPTKHAGPGLQAVVDLDDIAAVGTVCERIVANIEQVIEGKAATIRLGLAVLLAEGHLLIEDVPGVGKTKFAKALARSIDCTVRRVQFTPDLLPSDITGVSVYNAESRDFEFKPGPVFANIVVGDEINRASPKTQAALLECMEERQVTVDGVTYPLEAPFMVLATQNPIDMEGTYPLPEAQRDRFTARISMGYPDHTAEIKMLGEHAAADPLDALKPFRTPARSAHSSSASGRCTWPRASRHTRSTCPRPPGARSTCASALRHGPPCNCCARPRRGLPSTGATTSFPTTCRG